MLEDLDLAGLSDERSRELVGRLLNLIEALSADLRSAQAEVQRLRDENNRLKGEQSKPSIKANSPAPSDHSSERERRRPVERVKRSKINRIAIDREQVLEVDREQLPDDAVFKGYEDAVVQDVEVRTDNVLFRKEKWYAASSGRTYLAAMPAGYRGEFGPGLRALVLVFYYGSQMTEPKIADWLANVGIFISAGQISNLLSRTMMPSTPRRMRSTPPDCAAVRGSMWMIRARG
jgi:hypothetical protein